MRQQVRQIMAPREEALGVIPTFVEMLVNRPYGGKTYPRESQIYGDKEPIQCRAIVMTLLRISIPYVDVEVYLDGGYVDKVTTDFWGAAYYTFQSIGRGSHSVRMRFAGNFWYGESWADVAITTVAMVTTYHKSYVESLAASPTDLGAAIMDGVLGEQVGAQLLRIDVDTEKLRYIYTILVTEEPSNSMAARFTQAAVPLQWEWLIIALPVIIKWIAAALLAAAVLYYVIITYGLGQYMCGIDKERFTTCEALKEHMISAHSDVWSKIEANFECKPPGGEIPWALIVEGAVVVVGGLVVIELVRAFRR